MSLKVMLLPVLPCREISKTKKTHARPVVRDLTINHHRSSIIIDCDASRHHVGGGAMIAAQLQV